MDRVLVMVVCGLVGCVASRGASASASGDLEAVATVHAGSSPASDDAPAGSDHARGPTAAPDPALLDRVLQRHVRDGRVRYRALAADAEARASLRAFLEAAERMPPSVPLASWLNVYNALVIQRVLERYPINSVMDVKPDFFKKLSQRVAGELRTLDDIEHRVIRKRFPDARVHFALNCGAASCPPLSARAFRQATLDAELTALTKAAIADPRHVVFQNGRLKVSALFFWFREDFVRDGGSVLGWIQRHGPPAIAALPADTPLVEREYDWALAESP